MHSSSKQPLIVFCFAFCALLALLTTDNVSISSVCASRIADSQVNSTIATASTGDPTTTTSRSVRNVSINRLDVGLQKCSVMNGFNWDDFKYACQWSHGSMGYNLLFMRWDASVVYECTCQSGLSSYDPWGAWWTWSSGVAISCYTRTSESWWAVEHAYDHVSACAHAVKSCDTRTGSCTYL